MVCGFVGGRFLCCLLGPCFHSRCRYNRSAPTVHFARYVAVDRTKEPPETVIGVDVVTEDGQVVQALGASQRMQPGSFFDKVVYEHLIEMCVAAHLTR